MLWLLRSGSPGGISKRKAQAERTLRLSLLVDTLFALR